MIQTTTEHIQRYKGICSTLDTCIDNIVSESYKSFQPGRNEVSGDDVFCNCFDYETLPLDKAAWEGHIRYADVHMVLEGNERIGFSNVETLRKTSEDPEKDLVLYEGDVHTWVSLKPGDILIVFPEDIHMVKVADPDVTKVRKCVYKVLTD